MTQKSTTLPTFAFIIIAIYIIMGITGAFLSGDAARELEIDLGTKRTEELLTQTIISGQGRNLSKGAEFIDMQNQESGEQFDEELIKGGTQDESTLTIIEKTLPIRRILNNIATMTGIAAAGGIIFTGHLYMLANGNVIAYTLITLLVMPLNIMFLILLYQLVIGKNRT